MELWEIPGPACSVLVHRDAGGYSQPLELLDSPGVASSMMGRMARTYLAKFIPHKGLDRIGSRLRGTGTGFLELVVPNDETAIAFLLFSDGPMVVVCCNGYLREPNDDPPPEEQIEIARQIRDSYVRSKAQGTLEIQPLFDIDESNLGVVS